MAMFTRILLFSACLLSLTCCKRDDDASGPGIASRITDFERTACSGGTVTRFDFRGRHVFGFASNCKISDESFPIFDENGNLLCGLGGIAGNVDCEGVPFGKNASNRVVVYTKP